MKNTMANSCDATIATATLSLEDVVISKRGSKSCKLRCGDGELSHTTAAHLRVPFEPSTFDKDPAATRLSLAIECDEALEKYVGDIDAWLIKCLSDHSERIFKRVLSPEQVKANYNSCLKQVAGYPSTLKCKIDKQGRKGVCCWAPTGEQLPLPDNWREFSVKPKLHFSHLWIVGAQYGLVVQMTDAELVPRESSKAAARENPFK